MLDEKAAHRALQHPPGTTQGSQPLGRSARAGGRHGSLLKEKEDCLQARQVVWGQIMALLDKFNNRVANDVCWVLGSREEAIAHGDVSHEG